MVEGIKLEDVYRITDNKFDLESFTAYKIITPASEQTINDFLEFIKQ